MYQTANLVFTRKFSTHSYSEMILWATWTCSSVRSEECLWCPEEMSQMFLVY